MNPIWWWFCALINLASCVVNLVLGNIALNDGNYYGALNIIVAWINAGCVGYSIAKVVGS